MKKVLNVLIIITLGFIWGHSMMPLAVSAAESGAVGKFIEGFLELFVGYGNVTDNLVRKLAHITEYGALGVEFALWIKLTYKSLHIKKALCGLLACLIVAFIDETIQIFSGRGPLVTDIWIDLAGCTLGLFITMLIVKVFGKRKQDEEQTNDSIHI